MKYVILALSLIVGMAVGKAQNYNYDIFMVTLTDKAATPYSVFHPQQYLSLRAIERRERQQIAIDERDLPLSPKYLEAIKELGAEIHLQSKWLNAVAIYVKDSTVLEKVRNLSFVSAIEPLGKRRPVKEGKFLEHFPQEEYEKNNNFYGAAANQVAMLGGHLLHDLGHRGHKIQVAIFDGGFINVYRMPAFDSLYANSRILGTRDFVEGDEFVYEASTHGTNVLSCMAANLPYLIMGTAPDAAYYLFKTEDVGGEFRIEEFNWVAAAEYADSLGVDVVNSSLGYTTFNDKEMNYEYKNLNGKTGICTRGADIAVEKGMLIVNSAGNEGDGKWHYIGTPADGFNVISVGAVRANGARSNFSSYGPTPDGRIKPNVAAQGSNAVVAGFKGYKVTTTNGTSFSSPILAGMVAALWSACPDKTNWEIKDAIEASGHQTTQPDSSLGYGIPDFLQAFLRLQEDAMLLVSSTGESFSPKFLLREQMNIVLECDKSYPVTYILYNKLMQPIYTRSFTAEPSAFQLLEIPNLTDLSTGVYILRIDVGEKRFYSEVVK